MRHSAALTLELHARARGHLLRPDGQEDVAFALYSPSRGEERLSWLVSEILLPGEGDREVHGNVSYLPRFAERALRESSKRGCGLALMHSHPGGEGWQGMSPDDVQAEQGLAPRAMAMTGLPLLGMTMAGDGAWSARVWEKVGPRAYARRGCESVRIVGDKLAATFDDVLLPPPLAGEELVRTVSAWGSDAQAFLSRLRVGIVGCGSVGMPIAEGVARMGVQRMTLLDFDRVERRNLDRLLVAGRQDAAEGRLKVDLLAEHLRRVATVEGFEVRGLPLSVVEEEGFRAALDCDVLFSCVDRPWPRAAMNLIAYAHLVPVIDGGVYVAARASGGLRHADWRAHTAVPGRPCLECLGQYDPAHVGTERDGYLDDPRYIQGLPEGHALRRGENVFAFSLGCASLQLLQLLAMTVAPSHTDPGAQRYRFASSALTSDLATRCDPGCLHKGFVALGDGAPINVTARHAAAEASRNREEPSTTLTLFETPSGAPV